MPETQLGHQTTTSAFPFASSREAHGLQDLVSAAAVRRQPVAEGRSRAGKPELHSFVPIRVHSWFTVTPAFPFASSREAHGLQAPLLAAAISRQPVAEGRSRAGKPELPAFVSICVHSWFTVTPGFPFASSREAHGLQAPLPAAAVRRQPVAEGRSRAGKPELRLIESGDRGH